MPPAPHSRQSEPGPGDWFGKEPARQLIQGVQREAVPELTRVFGHSGLFLRPSAAVPAGLPGNMLAQVLDLHREGRRFAGQFDCEDAALPLASGSLALVYGLFVLETSDTPLELLQEMARVLKPEGPLLLLVLNPWSPAACAGAGRGRDRSARPGCGRGWRRRAWTWCAAGPWAPTGPDATGWNCGPSGAGSPTVCAPPGSGSPASARQG
jgi:SAM-dependent methyltransferase